MCIRDSRQAEAGPLLLAVTDERLEERVHDGVRNAGAVVRDPQVHPAGGARTADQDLSLIHI